MKILEDANFQKYLEDNNWIVECESPLEVRHSEGSFATNYAAQVLLNELHSQYKDENSITIEDADENIQMKNFEKLEKLFNIMDGYIQAAWQVEHDNPANESDEDRLSSQAYAAWDNTFSLVFSKDISHKIRDCFDALNVDLDYYDPDTTYKEDVLSYYNAVKDEVENLTKLFRPSSNKMRY
jgi:hypothetical protein